MMTKDNLTITRRVIEEIWNQKKLEVIDEIFADNFINHGRVYSNGREVVKRIFSKWLTAFPDFKYTLEEEIADQDRVVQRVTATGTFLGEFRFIPTGTILPTGKHFQVQHVHIYTLANSKIVEHRANRDDLGMLQQLGVISSPSQAERVSLLQELGGIPIPSQSKPS